MKIREIKDLIDRLRGSRRVLARRCAPVFGDDLEKLLEALSGELADFNFQRYCKCLDNRGEDSLDIVNRNPCLGNSEEFARLLVSAFSDQPPDEFEFQHAAALVGLPRLFGEYVSAMRALTPVNALPRLRPLPEQRATAAPRAFSSRRALEAAAGAADRFGGARVLDGNLKPLALTELRKVDEFYGFNSMRSNFDDYFTGFAAGRTAAPLFIFSLPGLGKTAMTIAYTLSHRELTLILPEPQALEEGLRPLLDKLANFTSKRFVIFFDDIDPRGVNWYFFRTNIGGSFATPPNVACVIAANYEFAPNLLSRGRLLTFPIFDEIRCMEMISDFLTQHRLRNPDPRLISVMAADYVEEFGQKKFAELSPRSLVRYLQIYISDAAKRTKMLDSSKQEMIVRPDAQLFYEQNIKLMRALYGDGYIEELLREKLRKLGGE